jgi:hypothetical protein
MQIKTCFVVMAIGDQTTPDGVVSEGALRRKYDDLIKEAIQQADPNLEVTRADDVAMPGTITTDIITRIMHSDLVVADVTYPNPNVFYELGLRHACKTGTIIIRERSSRQPPFDIAHLRYIEYENTSSGLKDLAGRLGAYISNLKKHWGMPDNQFQELARLTGYAFPNYQNDSSPEEQLMLAAFQSPKVMEIMMRSGNGEKIPQEEMMSAMLSEPTLTPLLVKAMVQNGSLSLGSNPQPQATPNRQARRNKKK